MEDEAATTQRRVEKEGGGGGRIEMSLDYFSSFFLCELFALFAVYFLLTIL